MSFLAENNTESFFYCLMDPIFFLIPIVPTTYLSFWAKEYFFDRRNYFFFFIAAVLIIVFGVFLYEFLENLQGVSGNSRAQNIFNFVFLQLLTVGLQYFKRGIVNQYQLQELKAEKALTELNALKAQLNPHFLFNTLNNIYGINQMSAEKGSEMIMELSEVMRYHLEFSKEGQVSLEEEIQLLNSYIKLEKLRLRDTCNVQVDLKNVDASLMISPLLFIPFVENAFKHGTHPNEKCFVHIKLITTDGTLFFSVRNSVIVNRKVVKTNIGLQNTKRRLELIFPQKHKLSISQKDDEHLVELSIEL